MRDSRLSDARRVFSRRDDPLEKNAIPQMRFFSFSSRPLLFSIVVLFSGPWVQSTHGEETIREPDRTSVLAAMECATRFLVEEVSYRGGYVWSYLPDFSRRWGELEARPTMIWVQPPGTPTVGELFLEAWSVTHDERYYEAARKAGEALIAGQLPCGGWNYVIDFAGEDSLREWYATIGRNAWRLEEFHHYLGNATFDDDTTIAAAHFLLKLYLAKKDPDVKAALDRAIAFVLESQHESGLWPQRYPAVSDADESVRYASYLTLNDDVSSGNLLFLAECHRVFGDPKFKDAIKRGMDGFVLVQHPRPQAGWAMQYTPALEPAGARSYEPKALVTHTTARVIDLLIRFHALTGDAKYLEPIPAALEWLESCRLTTATRRHATHPTFIEVGTGKPLYLHREGSNAVNGRYFADGTPEKLIGHYSSFRAIDTRALQARYEQALQQPARAPGEDWKWDALLGETEPIRERNPGPQPGRVGQITDILDTLDERGRWLTPLTTTSHPYRGDGPQERAEGDFSATFVGDETDTSPFGADEPIAGISLKTYLRNMTELIAWLRTHPESEKASSQ